MENNNNQRLVSFLLNGQNYLLWARAAKTALGSRGLWSHVEKDSPPTEKTTSSETNVAVTTKEQEKWFQEDQLTLTLIQGSLETKIYAAYSFIENAKQLWDTLKRVYGNVTNIRRIYEIKKSLSELNQDGRPFIEVLAEIQTLWSELEILRPPTADPVVLAERAEQDKSFITLSLLDSRFNSVVQHIIRMEKLPSFEDICSKISKEESALRFVGTHIEGAAFKAKGPEKQRQKCNHCGRSNHSKERCWELHPHLKPKRFNEEQSKVQKSAFTATNTNIRGEIEALLKEYGISKASEHDEGNKNIFLSTNKTVLPFIIDSGASNHIVSDPNMVTNIKKQRGEIVIANGEKVDIVGSGNLEIFDKQTKALIVPDLTTNLLSVHQATNDFDCDILFRTNDVLFQDTNTGKIIGSGSAKNNLYCVDFVSSKPSSTCFSSIKKSPSFSASLWHARLGHPHFKTLNKIFPNINYDNKKCESCLFGKHCRSVFKNSDTSYACCFDLIQSDIWTSPFVSHDNYKYFITFIDQKSKLTWLTLLKSKGEAYDAVENFVAYIANQYDVVIKILRTDNGG